MVVDKIESDYIRYFFFNFPSMFVIFIKINYIYYFKYN